MAYNALSSTITWAQQFNFNRNLALGTNSEPAITSANIIQQTILNPPFTWPWNRAVASFTCTAGTQDYPESVSNWGFAELATVQDINSPLVSNKWNDLAVSPRALPLGTEQGLPQHIAEQLDNGSGTITFRLQPVPDAAYPVTLSYQMQAPGFTTTSSTWGPIPNYYAYIYNWGFLALMFLYSDDPRFQVINQKFVASLLGAAQGLDETQRNIFLSNWQAITGQPISNQISTQQGYQARSV